jgi:hypothetical protein
MNVCEQVLYHAHGGGEKGSSTQGEALCPAPVLPALHEGVSHNEPDLSF